MKAKIEKKREKGAKSEQIVKNTNFGFIDDYIKERDTLVEMMEMENEINIPMTIRLNTGMMAILDHLVERWKSNRANIAAELLEKIIWSVFKKINEGLTIEEISELQRNLMSEFIKKRRKEKGE